MTHEQLRAQATRRIRDALSALAKTVLGPIVRAMTVCEEPHDGALVGAVDVGLRRIWLNLERNIHYSVENWCFVVGHLALHVAFDHERRREGRDPLRWNLVCEGAIDQFLRSFKVGSCPVEIERDAIGAEREEELYDRLFSDGLARSRLARHTLAGSDRCDLREESQGYVASRKLLASAELNSENVSAEALLAQGIRSSVDHAINDAAKRFEVADLSRQSATPRFAPIERAKRWVLAELPLLGALASHMKICSDAALCARIDVSVAAVDPALGELYFNPTFHFSDAEWLFVYAHELLHVALFHHSRARGRDPLLWNFAADFVVNAWLLEMGVGSPPAIGVLFDPSLRGMSVEDVYDLVAKQPRKYRGARTFRGADCDVLWSNPARGHAAGHVFRGDVQTLDDLYRRCLSQGLRCTAPGRGLVPRGLYEEIESLFCPPVPWDVELARWMEEHVPYPRDPRRSYARASRRQSSTPDIPRPARYIPTEAKVACTFGVVLDTSGSMDRVMLGRALGAIASFAESRDVPAVRLVQCDARPYDRGVVSPSDLRGAVAVQGRGGTVLQPAIGYLCARSDFPSQAPIMVLTDGGCEDTIVCAREHCFVMPRRDWGANLKTTAPVFRVLRDGLEGD